MDDIKRLREKTGAGVIDAKKSLEEAQASEKVKSKKEELMTVAEEIIRAKGLAKAEKKAERETGEGLIFAYVHHDGKSGAMIELKCETDFVARTDEFKDLAKELAMQVASMKPKDVAELLEQEYIREPDKKIKELIAQVVAKTGENIKVVKCVRMELGQTS